MAGHRGPALAQHRQLTSTSRLRAVAALMLLPLGGCGDGAEPQDATDVSPPTAAPTSAPAAISTSTVRQEPVAVRRWKVYRNDVLVLEVTDEPGPIVSTAALPPDPAFVPPTNPYLSASARHPGSESEVHRLLEQARSLEQFLALLTAAGFRVVEVTGG